MRIGRANITINGRNNIISGFGGKGVNISQVNGRTFVNGKDVTELAAGELADGVLKIIIEEGVVASITSDVGVQARDVVGNVEAGNGVSCGNVGGSVRAGNSVNCGNIKGSVRAGNNVNHR